MVAKLGEGLTVVAEKENEYGSTTSGAILIRQENM
jgi:hypothetical protein